MNRSVLSFLPFATRRFGLMGFHYMILLKQRFSSLFSNENQLFESFKRIFQPAGYSARIGHNMWPVRKYRALVLTNGPLLVIPKKCQVIPSIDKTINKLVPKSTFIELLGKSSYPKIYVTAVPLQSKFFTLASDEVPEKSLQPHMDSQAGPERDLINFPRPVRREYPDKVRHGFIPETWFECFYSKTGATGPYVLGFGVMTFLISKEIYVLEHEFYTGISMAILCHYCVKINGPALADYLDKMVDEHAQHWETHKNMEQKYYEDGIKQERLCQFQCEGQKMLFEIKKQNVAIQLECEYRKRLWEAYNEVVKQLEKEMLKKQVVKCVTHKHILQWVLKQVIQGITPSVEIAAMKWSISHMLELAFHHQGAHFPTALRKPRESDAILACVSQNPEPAIFVHEFTNGGSAHELPNDKDIEEQTLIFFLQPSDSELK